MINTSDAFATIPDGLRSPLIQEYQRIVESYKERKWLPSELSGGRFCEVVYTILSGYATGNFAAAPAKPRNFVQACRALENNAQVPRSFQILIPRLLPALYEIRNNRGVGHVGGDVDPNYMDATVVLELANWVMAELVRVFHDLAVEDAQIVADQLVERTVPLVWQGDDVRRVLDPSLSLKDQIMLLIGSCPLPPSAGDLFEWTESSNRTYFNRAIRDLHSKRLINISPDESAVQLLPPGAAHIDSIVKSKSTI